MAGSNPGEKYPYPSHVCAPNFVTVKLSGRDKYDVWETQMLCLLESHDMLGFIKGNPHAENMLWRRSDALVKGWILGSLSQQTLKYVVKPVPITAKDVWDKLQTIYAPPLQDDAVAAADHVRGTEERIREEETEEGKTQREEAEERKRKKEKVAELLYEATLRQNFWSVERILKRGVVTLGDKIAINGNTALHVAVGTTNKNMEFLGKMLKLATQDNQQPLDIRNSEGSTLLHVAAIVGNTEAAKMLVEKNKELLFIEDKEGQTPVARALSNMHKDTYLYLSGIGKADGASGYELLVNIISSNDYGAALYLVQAHKDRFLSHIDSVLMAIAQNFPHKLNFCERTIQRCMSSVGFTFSGYHFAAPLKFKFVEALERKEKNYIHAEKLLVQICFLIEDGRLSRSVHHCYNDAILEATRQNAYEVVKIIVSEFPNAIWSTNEDGHNIIQYAVINRSEKIYNLLYQMSEHRNIYKTVKDPFGNNLLHLAARLAPTNKLNHISGAASQIQFELQWFKEVEGFVCPLNVIQKNLYGETPQMVFTREHKDLVIDGEKWMKETAQSYTITAALIITIVFAAAITVPGGNKQDIGTPVFGKKAAFTIFAVADTISLFTSVTSLLMFLSILTARFSEQDFLFKLPTKLIIGLTTLFISTTAMLVAFGATLYLMFCENNPLILVPIAALTCLPITSFVSLQFPLIKDLVSSTYCRRSTFGKKSDDLFY